ncbi:MAG: DUF6311 domain-containing protein [Rhizomicrobium sp.]
MAFPNSIVSPAADSARHPTIAGPASSPGFRAVSLVCIAAVLGLLDAAFLIGWHAIDPLHTDWLKSDPTVFQAGWEFMRRQPLTFPPTWISQLNFPFGISAAYLDVIPIVAVPFRILSPILPAAFQYFGIYLAFCLIMQAYYGFRLVSRFTNDKPAILLGGLFFLNSPVLLSRLYIHFSLCSQWLILAALYYYFAPADWRKRFRFVVPFLPLLAVSAGVTPYLAVMVLFIGLAALLRSCIESRASEQVRSFGQPWLSAVVFSGLMLAAMAASLLLFGLIVPGADPVFKGDGYTMFSLNLLSPFDRHHFLPGTGYEGYSYLGLGVLLLIGIGLARRPGMITKLWTAPIRPLLIMSVTLTLLALSARISLGQTTLFTIPLPHAISDLLAIFRGSGRFFWPVYYLLVLFAVVGAVTSISGREVRLVVIAAAFLIQFVDTAPLRSAAAEQIRRAGPASRTADDVEKIAVHYRHLIILPAFQCSSSATVGGDAGWPPFARMAARTGLTLNSVHAARISAASVIFNCRILPQQVRRGELQADTAYVLNSQLAAQAMEHNARLYCRPVDDLNVCILDPVHAPLARSGPPSAPAARRRSPTEVGLTRSAVLPRAGHPLQRIVVPNGKSLISGDGRRLGIDVSPTSMVGND